MRKILIATDHAGFELKNEIVQHLEKKGYDVEDFGANTYDKNDDYPDFIKPLAKEMSETPESEGMFGIILGGSGTGEAIVANRYKNVRAVSYYFADTRIITLAREHNNANILSLGARFLTKEDAIEAVDIFIKTPFSADKRHIRRIEKI